VPDLAPLDLVEDAGARTARRIAEMAKKSAAMATGSRCAAQTASPMTVSSAMPRMNHRRPLMLMTFRSGGSVSAGACTERRASPAADLRLQRQLQPIVEPAVSV
jgi:hypothetical protein